MVDDDPDQLRQIKEILEEDKFPNEEVILEPKSFLDLENLNFLEYDNYDIIILDLFDSKTKEYIGEKILKAIQEKIFIPIIFYTGYSGDLKEKESEIIKIVNKEKGYGGIKKAIKEIIDSNIPSIKKKISIYLKDKFREYMWDFVHKEWEHIHPYLKDGSASYLLTKRLTHALSEKYILDILEEETKEFLNEKHPLEHYIYPSLNKEIGIGDLISKGDKKYVILTPSCDFIKRTNGKRKADHVLLVELIPLKSMKAYEDYIQDKTNGKKADKLKSIIKNEKERYYFLPETWFIDDSLIDFQKTTSIQLDELESFEKIAELDTLHINSVLALFVRYYNRIGTKDLNPDKILDRL